MVYPALENRADLLKMLDEMTQARKQILDSCAALTAEKLVDPVYTGTWSLLKNLTHLAWAEAFMMAWIDKRPGVLTKEEWPLEPALELPAVRKALDENHAAAIAFLKANPEAVLKEKCQFGRHGEQTVGGVFFHIVEHEIGHRAFINHKLGKLKS